MLSVFALLFASRTVMAAPLATYTPERIELQSGYVEFRIGAEPMFDPLIGREGSHKFYISDGSQGFLCDVTFTKKNVRKIWLAYADYFAMVATEASQNPNAKWSVIKKGLTSSRVVGYCNGTASTQDGQIALSFMRNRECFGTAGCTTEALTVSVTTEQLLNLSEKFRQHSP